MFQRARLSFEAGLLCRNQARCEIEKFLDRQEGITYQFKEYKGWFSSDYLLIIEGDDFIVRRVSAAIQKWLKEME